MNRLVLNYNLCKRYSVLLCILITFLFYFILFKGFYSAYNVNGFRFLDYIIIIIINFIKSELYDYLDYMNSIICLFNFNLFIF